MDLTTIKTDVTTWVTNNKLTAAAIGVAVAGAIFYFATAKKHAPAKPHSASLSGHGRSRRHKKSHHMTLAKLK